MALKYTINTVEKTATMELFVGGVYITSYTYNNGLVTLLPLPSGAVLSESELQTSLGQISKWIGIVKSELTPPAQKRSKFTEDVDKKNNKVQALFKNDGATVTDAEYDPETHIFTFNPRVEIILNFNCYDSWYNFLYRFFQTGITF
jgi:hypothetical protein